MEGLKLEVQSQGVQDALEQFRAELGDRAAARILRLALRRACTEIRSRIRSTGVPGPVRQAAAATLGYKVEVRRGVLAKAKLGFGLRRRGGSRWSEQHRLGLRSGVGLSERNIHWAVLGTSPRKTRRGLNRGRMPAYFQGFLANTTGRLRELLYEAALADIQKQIQKIQSR
jgi:hypothetical protein